VSAPVRDEVLAFFTAHHLDQFLHRGVPSAMLEATRPLHSGGEFLAAKKALSASLRFFLV
jgi:hypothetical protein